MIKAVKKGGRDDYGFKSSGAYADGLIDEMSRPETSVFGGYGGAAFSIVEVTDASGRQWGIDVKTREIFRFERMRSI